MNIISNSMLIYAGPTIKAHTDYLRLLERRARAGNVEGAQASAARVLELAAPRIAWFEGKYGEWLATGADAVWGYLDAPPQSSSSGPLSKLCEYYITQYADLCRAHYQSAQRIPVPAWPASTCAASSRRILAGKS